VAVKDTVLDDVLTLVQDGTIERRCAALLVLGALQRQDQRVVDAAGQALSQANPVLKDLIGSTERLFFCVRLCSRHLAGL